MADLGSATVGVGGRILGALLGRPTPRLVPQAKRQQSSWGFPKGTIDNPRFEVSHGAVTWKVTWTAVGGVVWDAQLHRCTGMTRTNEFGAGTNVLDGESRITRVQANEKEPLSVTVSWLTGPPRRGRRRKTQTWTCPE